MPIKDIEQRRLVQREAQRKRRELVNLGGENPVITLREKLNISRGDFSLLTGIRYNSIIEAERGYLPHLSMLFLGSLASIPGVDPVQIAREYESWRKMRGEALKKTLFQDK